MVNGIGYRDSLLRALLLTLSVVAAVTAPAPARGQGLLGIFWSEGRTYVVDVEKAALYSAPQLVTTGLGDDRRLHRHRLRLEVKRPGRGDAAVPTMASRRVIFERSITGERAFVAVLAPVAWPTSGFFRDELIVHRFAQAQVTIGRYVRGADAEGRPYSACGASTYTLPQGTGLDVPKALGPAMTYLRTRVPGFEAVGSTEGAALVVVSHGPRPRSALALPDATGCVGGPRLLPLEVSMSAGEGALRYAAPDGATSLLLDELPRTAEPSRAFDLTLDADAPCERRILTLDRGDGRLTVLGEVPSLDGLHFVKELDDPFRVWAAAVFGPSVGCALGAPLVSAVGSADWNTALLRPRAPLCGLVEVGRAWAGLEDLGAASGVRLEGERATVNIRVWDTPPMMAGDAVRLLTPKGSLELTAQGTLQTDGLAVAEVQHFVKPTDDGFAVELTFPRAFLGPVPALAIAIDDVDATDKSGQALRLWIAGEPIGTRGGRPVTLLDVGSSVR